MMGTPLNDLVGATGSFSEESSDESITSEVIKWFFCKPLVDGSFLVKPVGGLAAGVNFHYRFQARCHFLLPARRARTLA